MPDPPRSTSSTPTVARNGRVYFTDASQRFTPARWGGTMQAAMLDVFEQ